jgi:hypothetical protein
MRYEAPPEQNKPLAVFSSLAGGLVFAAGWWVFVDGFNMGMNVANDSNSKSASGYAWLPPFVATLFYVVRTRWRPAAQAAFLTASSLPAPPNADDQRHALARAQPRKHVRAFCGDKGARVPTVLPLHRGVRGDWRGICVSFDAKATLRKNIHPVKQAPNPNPINP